MKKSIIILLSISVVGIIFFLLIYNKDSSGKATVDFTEINFSKDGDVLDVGRGNLNLYEADEFSFKHSEKLDVSRVPDSGGEIIVAENDGFGFQIFIMPFSEAGPITIERIQKDLPNMKTLRPNEIKLSGVDAITFYSHLGELGETFEAWVVHKNKLYQIATSRDLETALLEVLTTWSWK